MRREVNNIDHDDLGIKDIINALCRGTAFLNGNLAVEAKLDFEVSARLKAGEGITARIARTLESGFMDYTLFMEKGQLLEFDSDDPLFKPYSKIKEHLNIDSHGEGSIRKSIERKSLLK